MDNHLSASVEDYLKVIYELTSHQSRASTNEIAERMKVTPASATGMIQKLASADPPLIDYQKHHGVSLTAAGERSALEIIRHHRLLELFLQEKLGYTWDEVHREADRLEHVISEDLEERISQALGDPAYDPHGEPIPDRKFKMPSQPTDRLSDLRPGDMAIVQRIADDDPDLLRYLAEIGLTPKSRVAILDYSPFDDNLRLQLSGQDHILTLGPRITRQVYVKIEFSNR
jgi:DtxR family transcriptional regulator, Mn-dependent transcriptional regulator